MAPADRPTEMRQRCEEEAQELVQHSNTLLDGQQSVTNTSHTQLVSRLTALLLQIKVNTYSDTHPSPNTQNTCGVCVCVCVSGAEYANDLILL